MSVLDRKLRRELKSSWLMLGAITSIIAVGVACLVAMGSAYNNLGEAKRRYYVQCRMADFSIELKKVPLAELGPLAELPGVVEIRPRIQFHATVDLDDTVKPLNGLVLSLPNRREPIINDVVLRQGGYFTETRENEVLVNDAFARKHGLRPGDWIRLVLNNRSQELFIVGTAISSEFVYLLGPGAIMPDPEHFGVFYLKQTYAEDVFDFNGAANQVLGRLVPGVRERPQALLRQAEDLLAGYGVFGTTPLADQASNRYVSQEIAGLKSFAVVMPTIFLAVAALVLNVLLTRLADQQRTVVGTLKALGYSNRQVFAHFLKFGLAVGLTGGLLGCLLGYGLIADWMTAEYRKYFEFPELTNRFYPGLQSAGLLVSVACAVLGSLRGTRAVLRLNPAEAMRPKPPKEGGAVWLERIGWLWRRLSSGWRMVLRGIVRSRVRTAAGMFAAMMGASVLVTGFMMVEATTYLIDFQFKWTLRSDVELTFKDEHSTDALLETARLPGVDRAEPRLGVGCTFFNGPYRKKASITGLAPDARLTVPRDRQARPIRIPSTGLAMSRKLAEILHLKRGDVVRFRPVKGLRQTHEVPVAEIVDSYMGTTVYADIHYLSRLVGEELAVTSVQLATDRNPLHTAALYRELKRMPALEAVNSRTEMIAMLEDTLIQNMWVFIGALVVFAGVVFFGSILNSSLVSLAERQREVATLRVLGYGPWQIGSLLLRESLIVTLIGTVLGMPLGYFLTVLTSWAYDSELFRFPVYATPRTWVWTLLLAVLFTLSAHLAVQRAIHKMDWLEALQAKE
ncbi:MAG: ABC transporter permease [Pirellulales bacterium]|nr:ABC transporter permease [Pirellulales bacterium]